MSENVHNEGTTIQKSYTFILHMTPKQIKCHVSDLLHHMSIKLPNIQCLSHDIDSPSQQCNHRIARPGRDTFRVIVLTGGCEDSAAFYHCCKKKKLTGSVFGELHCIITGVAACVLRVDNLDKGMEMSFP